MRLVRKTRWHWNRDLEKWTVQSCLVNLVQVQTIGVSCTPTMTLEPAQPAAELVTIQQVSVFLQIKDRTKLIPQSRLIRFSSVNSFEGLGLCRPAKQDYSLGYALLSNHIKYTICLLFQPLDLFICKLSSKNSNENTHSWNLNSHFSWLKLLLFTSEHLVNFLY